MLNSGPKPQNHTNRLALVYQLSDRLQTLYGGKVVTIALYGSVARQQDGPYSDIELLCIIDEPEMDISFEWVYGAGKAEINVLGRNDAHWEAKEVDKYWAISKGAFLDAQLVFGDETCLEELRDLVLSISDDEINTIIGQVIVEELYEWIGKARNALHTNSFTGVPSLACKFAETVSLLLGLAHRTCYTTGIKMLDESLQFDDLPTGYQDLCNLVRWGKLSDPKETIMAIEAGWSGLVSWATQRSVQVQIGAWPFSEKART
ncbi:MAG: hypothetical protein GWN55_14640 [Phycisphaerae bacterium]|nr:hypothetical protein [Gammaproteobacteria bacterium]NIV02534.1 hypothetical protein [Phycisphaerae bacterium]